MTYNFDPDQWYENERTYLEARHERGELDAQAYEEALAQLGENYEAMLVRLDGSFELPPAGSS